MSLELKSFTALEEEEEGTQEWLVTYGDMVTLLLTFFVFLFSLSTLDTERFESIRDSIQFTLGASVAPGGQLGRLDSHDTPCSAAWIN